MEKHNNFQESTSQAAVVMVPLPAQGHLNQLLHLSRLIAATNTTVYYVGAATHLRQAQLRLHGWDSSSAINIHFKEFPIPPFTNPPPDPLATHKFPSQLVPALTAATHLRHPIHKFVDELSKVFKKVVIIYDALMSYVVQDLGSIRNADCYTFRSISCFSVCSWEAHSWPNLPAAAAAGVLKEVPSVEGYYSKEFQEFLDLQYTAKKVSRGEIFNSCREIEGFYLDLWKERIRENGGLDLWALGPFNPAKNPKKTDHKLLKWMDKQPLNSVILISFGTTASFSDEQIGEIAVGLERSGQRFIWILRDADRGDVFAGDSRKLRRLPEGFEERVRERGVVDREWAPQVEILGHPSTGGFVSHCGWNSCLESITAGVPMAAWPMHSDQPANAVLVARVLRVGVELERWNRPGTELVVGASRVEEVVRRLMATAEGDEMRKRAAEGDEMRKRAAELGEAVRNSIGEGGKIESFIAHINR